MKLILLPLAKFIFAILDTIFNLVWFVPITLVFGIFIFLHFLWDFDKKHFNINFKREFQYQSNHDTMSAYHKSKDNGYVYKTIFHCIWGIK